VVIEKAHVFNVVRPLRPEAVAPKGGDMEGREGGRVSARREQEVAPALEPTRVLPSGR
jgi:hypothetical protein